MAVIPFTQTNRFTKGLLPDAQQTLQAQAVVGEIGQAVAEQRDLILTGSAANVVGGDLEFQWQFTTVAGSSAEAYPTLPLIQEWMKNAMAGAVQGALGLDRLTMETIL